MKHKGQKLTVDDRLTIQACIAKKMKIKDIAIRLNVHISTIYRELERNIRIKKSPIQCYKIKFSSSLCNNCSQKNVCAKERRYYDFTHANNLANERKVKSRSHLTISNDNLKIIDAIVSNGVEKGQSIHHIYISNPILSTICCEETVRRLCYKGYLSVKSHQLPRFVRYSRKYIHKKEPVDVKLIAKYDGRTYSDFLDLTNRNSRLSIVQFDSVIGKYDDEKAILTITLPKYRFQFGILYNKLGGTNEINKKLACIFKTLGYDLSRKIFAVCLSDNGSEFARFSEIEKYVPGIKTFYTNPYKATDKPHCERNHEFIRYIIPKSSSLDNLAQDKVNLMFSHINSYVRKSNKNKTPYDLVVKRFSKSFMIATGILKVKANDICLKPSLIK